MPLMTSRPASTHGPAPCGDPELPPYSRRRPRTAVITSHTTAFSSTAISSATVTTSSTSIRPQPHARAPTEHILALDGGWAVLHLRSSARSARTLPAYHEKDTVTGALQVRAGRLDGVHEISATLAGRVISGPRPEDACAFLEERRTLFARPPGPSRRVSVAGIVRPSTSGGVRSGNGRRPSTSAGAMMGSRRPGDVGSTPAVAGLTTTGHALAQDPDASAIRTFPILIPFPREVAVGGRSVKPPETFVEERTPVSVQYELTLTLSRGMLRSASHIRTPLSYVPSTRPSAPSLVRQLAQEQGYQVPGPMDDPQGWSTMLPAIIKGKVFKARKVEIQCTLSLANPLAYTRGTALPVALTLRSPDAQALDLLAVPSAIRLRLRRRVRYWAPPASRPREVAWSEALTDLASATWWPGAAPTNGRGIRHLAGEVLLPRDLAPTGGVHTFSVSYSVVLLPFEAPGFAAKRPDETVISESVEITTKHPRGHGARQQPPAYE